LIPKRLFLIPPNSARFFVFPLFVAVLISSLAYAAAVHKIVGTLITHCSIFFGSETIECFDLQLQNQAEAL
jgi:hypothetical protein